MLDREVPHLGPRLVHLVHLVSHLVHLVIQDPLVFDAFLMSVCCVISKLKIKKNCKGSPGAPFPDNTPAHPEGHIQGESGVGGSVWVYNALSR